MVRSKLLQRRINKVKVDSPESSNPELKPLVLKEGSCMVAPDTYEFYGATRVNAQVANRELAAGVYQDGTVTVFRYPNPSYFDQLDHKTDRRDKKFFGADANDGALIGVRLHRGDSTEFMWLRDMPHEQEYLQDWSDTIRTTYGGEEESIEVVVTDAVHQDVNALLRHVDIDVSDDSNINQVDLVAYENINPTHVKRPATPTQDWCHDRENVGLAQYNANGDFIVHQGGQATPSVASQVAIGMAFKGESDRHQVGVDSQSDGSRPLASMLPKNSDAFFNAEQGRLNGNGSMAGAANGAMTKEMVVGQDDLEATVIMTGGSTVEEFRNNLTEARGLDPQTVWEQKLEWFTDDLADVPLPDTDDEDILKLAKRALVCIYHIYHEENGALVASISTQPPYNLDWIRDGVFFNVALELMGKQDWVEQRNKWYQELQAKRGKFPNSRSPATPVGNWVMNYYADGLVGGPIPFEIDATSYGLWTMWYHYEVTEDEAYLEEIYPAIKRTADWLARYRDPSNKLQAPAPEDDHIEFTQTAMGAFPVKLALESAWRAADTLGFEDDRDKYKDVLETHKEGIENELWDEEGGFYGKRKQFATPKAIWPASYISMEYDRIQRHMEAAWEQEEPVFNEPEAGELEVGLYESKFLTGLAKGWKDEPERLEMVRDALKWVATEHATSDTHHMGEIWMNGDLLEEIPDSGVVTGMGTPHIWEQTLFYLASIEAFPPVDKPLEEMATSRGVIGELLGTADLDDDLATDSL